MAFDKRTSGLLLHVTSLPGRHGSGDLGNEAIAFVDFAKRARQRWWQMLPVGPIGPPPGYSPYTSSSSHAGEPMLISPDLLREAGLLTDDQAAPSKQANPGKVRYRPILKHRTKQLRQAYDNVASASRSQRSKFEQFCEAQRGWLDDVALFFALKHAYNDRPWWEWDRKVARRDPAALKNVWQSLAGEIRYQQFVQYQFRAQWQRLHDHARRQKVGLIGDVPIFVAHDSVDVWCARHLFKLDRAGMPTRVSGYPPDPFSKKGQLWGHPQYAWSAHEREGFAWWTHRFAGTLELFDAVRIDHFLGFDRVWSIPAKGADARKGRWVDTPGRALFLAMRAKLGKLPIIAEDLGRLTDRAAKLRDDAGFPGMRIMLFAAGGDYHRPYSYPTNSVAYTGTHDNDTVVGFYRSLKPPGRRQMLKFFGATSPETLPESMLRMLHNSPANTVITPIQDVLGLDGKHRMNVPGTEAGNWVWRATPDMLKPTVADRLADLTRLYGRA